MKTKLRRRMVFVYLPAILIALLGYLLWSPGQRITSGRHDRKHNGMWLSHGWLGDDNWFTQNKREDQLLAYRDHQSILSMISQLQLAHITDVFPHLCPTSVGGELPSIDPQQALRFLPLAQANGLRVIPWIGGVFEKHCFPAQATWRERFVASVAKLLTDYPHLAGVHLNVEPWPSGNADMLMLLDELNAAIPHDKILSIAAYPPPTRWQPAIEVHWDEAYFKQVASRADQLVVMMYDTGISSSKFYQLLMRQWTGQVLSWAQSTPTLLGLPAYDDAGVAWHDPRVENLTNALHGIHAGLIDHHNEDLTQYQGIAVYCHWEMTAAKWETLRREFINRR
jgi:hypothetical protein